MKNLITLIGEVILESKGQYKTMELEKAWQDFSYKMEIKTAQVVFDRPIERETAKKGKTTKKKIVKKEN